MYLFPIQGYKVDVCSKTHIGLKRKRNEDSYAVVLNKGIVGFGNLFIVADGMGGHPKGDLASKLAVDTVKEFFFTASNPLMEVFYTLNPNALAKRLKQAVEIAQKTLCKYEITHRECHGFGTTLSILLLRGRKAIIANVGDSRIYRMRNNRLDQLTKDDTLVQEMVDDGTLSLEDAKTSPYRHVLTQALGGGFEGVHTNIFDVKKNDTYLLSTDGLHDLVSHQKIKEILIHHDTEVACDILVETALRRGGKDNITVIVVRTSIGLKR